MKNRLSLLVASFFVCLVFFSFASVKSAFAVGVRLVEFDGTNYTVTGTTSKPDGQGECVIEDFGTGYIDQPCTITNGVFTLSWPATTFTPEADHQKPDHGYKIWICSPYDGTSCTGTGEFLDASNPDWYRFNFIPRGVSQVSFDGTNYTLEGFTGIPDGTRTCVLEDFGTEFVNTSCTVSSGHFSFSWTPGTYTPERDHQLGIARGYTVVIECIIGDCAGSNDFVDEGDARLFNDIIPTPTPTATATPTPTPIPQLTTLSPAHLWMSKPVNDLLLRVDVLAEVYKDTTLVSSGQLNSVNVGTFFGNMTQITIPFNSFSSVNFPGGSQLKVKVSTRNACSGSIDPNGTVNLFFNDSGANSRFDATIGGTHSDFYLRNGFVLTPTLGTGPRQTVSVQSGSQCSAFKTFGTWIITP